MFKASSLVLLTLVLNVPLCSSAPIHAKGVQEPGQDPVAAAPSPVIPVGASGEPLLVVPGDTTEVEPVVLPTMPEEDESVPAEPETGEAGQWEAAAEESAPEEPAVFVPVEPAEQEPEQKKTISVICLKTQEESATEEPVVFVPVEPAEQEPEEEETAVFVPVEPAEQEPEEEETAVFVPVEPAEQEPEEEEPVVFVPVEPAEQEPEEEEPVVFVPVEPAEQEPEEEETAVFVPVEPTEQEPEEEETAVFVPVEPAEQAPEQEETVSVISSETQEESAPEETAIFVPVEPAEQEPEPEETVSAICLKTQEESAPEEPAVFVPVEPAEQEETFSSISSEPQEEEAPDKQEEAAGPEFLEEDAPPSVVTEEESALFPEEPETEKVNEVDPAAEQTTSQDSSPEDLVVIVPLDPAKEEPDLREQEGSDPNASPEAPEQEAIEEHAEEEVAGWPVPIVPEENCSAIDELLPGAPKEEESVVIETGEDGQEETTPALEEPAVVVFVEPSSKGPALEDLILPIPLEDTEEDAPDDDAGDDDVPSDRQETALEEAAAGDGATDVLLTSVTESPSENDTVETALDPGVEVPEAATEILTESPTEAVKARPAPAVSEAKLVPTPRQGGNGISRHVKAAAIIIKEEPVAPVKRGAVLGAAFFTLTSFIVIGFVGMMVSKKLR